MGIKSLKDLDNKNLYYIGGIVRDEILNIPCFDIDITYEGDAIEFCKNLQADNYKILQINEKFGTVKIQLNDKTIDVASTRDETYPQKGHLPVVQDIGCELKRDVLRRDFTINAIAKSILNNEFIDYTNGLEDIKNKILRVLHDNSFIDDPSRIVRGLKFSVRFGFELEKHTRKLQQEYLENVNYDMSYKRLKKELMETFNLNSQLAYEKFFEQKIYKLLSKDTPKYYNYDIESLVKNHPVDNVWLVYLGTMNLKSLPLTKTESKIINDYKTLLCTDIPDDSFEIYQAFKDKEPESILIYTITTGSNLGLKYLKIKNIKPIITGKDLIKLGLCASPKFKECFEYILKQKLNNKNMTYETELSLAKKFFNCQ